MAEQARSLAAAVSIPLIADADTGYGNALAVRRTVQQPRRQPFALRGYRPARRRSTPRFAPSAPDALRSASLDFHGGEFA
jgi:hypothetical protein